MTEKLKSNLHVGSVIAFLIFGIAYVIHIVISWLYALHGNGKLVMLMRLSSLAAIEVVKITASRAAIGEYLPTHDDVIKWKHFPRNWPFVRGIHRSPVNSLHKGQWRGALMFSLICVWLNDWVNYREAGDLRRYRTHYDVIVMNDDISNSVMSIQCGWVH